MTMIELLPDGEYLFRVVDVEVKVSGRGMEYIRLTLEGPDRIIIHENISKRFNGRFTRTLRTFFTEQEIDQLGIMDADLTTIAILLWNRTRILRITTIPETPMSPTQNIVDLWD